MSDLLQPLAPNAEVLSTSHLAMLANQKKIRESKSSSKHKLSISLNSVSSRSDSPPKKSSSRESSKRDRDVPRKEVKREIKKENRNSVYLKQKLDIINQLSQITLKTNMVLYVTLDVAKHSLEEFQTEHKRIMDIINNKYWVDNIKQGICMTANGVEMLNNRFDPLGVDLNGYGTSMNYEINNKIEYDNVISELYEKYKTSETLSPEYKLLLMLVVSTSSFALTKQLAKNPSGLLNQFSNVFAQGNRQEPRAPPPSPPSDLTIDDPLPSKFNGLNTEQEVKDIMNKIQTQRHSPVPSSSPKEESDDLIKNIPIVTRAKRGRGRGRGR